MNKKQQIIFLYYEKGFLPTEIAKDLNVSKAYITEVIKSDERYILEKQKRKSINKTKNREETKKYIKNKRMRERIFNEYIKKMHLQATMELSSRKMISNRSFRNWNTSIYDYNNKTKAYQLKNDVTVTNDVPIKINIYRY